MKNFLIGLLIIIIVVGGSIGLAFGMGWINVGYTNTVGIAQANADRNVFEHNKAHIEGMSKDLAKYKYDFDTEKDVVNKKAIVQLIQHQFADFNPTQIENYNLRYFLEDVMNGKYNNLEGN